MAELIKVGEMQLRFLRTKYDTSGALDMFEVVIPPNSRMPVPHHHRDWEETIYDRSTPGFLHGSCNDRPANSAAGYHDDALLWRRVVERWSSADFLGLMIQLGGLTPPKS
ncbi:hypothetical protein [Bradyrhizobium sp. RDM4]|uniref:hypothetical protein n=1 Tax=Bradyrhizobium sp. RDM4 TaxID=3378765 RepID=UPI0038FC4FAC